MHSARDNFIITLSLTTDVTDVTLGASGLWLGTRAGAGGTATPASSFFDRSPWVHGQQIYFTVYIPQTMTATIHVYSNNRLAM